MTPPIHLSTTFERQADGEFRSGLPIRERTARTAACEECLAALEGGKETLAFASGMAVLTAVLQGLEPGDHVLAPADVYYGMRQVMNIVLAKWPMEITYVNMTDLDSVAAAVRPSTRLIWVETPSNPLLEITDLAAVGSIARRANAISICDGTFATPALQRPLDFGIDMVMHSTTKYLGGHADLLGGSLTTHCDNYLFERVRNAQRYSGAVPSAFDCWLALRGSRALPWRMQGHVHNASAIANFLQTHPAVEQGVLSGLPSHPGHDLAADGK